MDGWSRTLRNSVTTGALASATTLAMVAARGRRDSGSAIAPVNASSHVIWGESAAREGFSAARSLPGLMINAGAGVWWALVMHSLFGAAIGRRGAPAALLAGAATAGLAYAIDYRLLPRRLTPGWELRLSRRSLFMSLGAMAAGLAVGAWLTRGRV